MDLEDKRTLQSTSKQASAVGAGSCLDLGRVPFGWVPLGCQHRETEDASRTRLWPLELYLVA